MADILDYLDWRGDISFEASPFNEVDNLIFSALSYIDFSQFVSPKFSSSISLKKLFPLLKKEDQNNKNLGLFINKKTIDLFFKAAQTKRFQNVLLRAHVQILDRESETQFSATTFSYEKNKHCIAFRGTDDSILGWKEDFNMAFLETIPSQIEALSYFQKAVTKISGTFILSGHSKGGNLAIYAGSQSLPKEKKRLIAIYSNDGPGFHKNITEQDSFLAIEKITQAFIPEFSIIGLLLNHRTENKIVESSETGMMSHDPFSWKVCGPRFVLSKKLDKKSDIIDTTLKNWLSELDPITREQFIDTFFEAFIATKAKTLTELSKDWFKHSTTIIKTLHLADKKNKDLIAKAMQKLFLSYIDVKFNKK